MEVILSQTGHRKMTVFTHTQNNRTYRCGLLPMKELGCIPLYEISFRKGNDVIYGGKDLLESVKEQTDNSKIVGYMLENQISGTVPYSSIVQGSNEQGYVFPVHKDSKGVNLMKLYYSRGRCDHSAVATSAGEQDLLLSLGDCKHEYCFEKPIGSVEVSDVDDTTPLFRMWHGHHLNSTLAARPETIDSLIGKGYCKVRIEGHVFEEQTFFTSPLTILYHAGRKDSTATCDEDDIKAYIKEGYVVEGIEGYIYYCPLATAS